MDPLAIFLDATSILDKTAGLLPKITLIQALGSQVQLGVCASW